jgi:hypothetical protein
MVGIETSHFEDLCFFFMKVMDVAGIIPWEGERRGAEFGASPPL